MRVLVRPSFRILERGHAHGLFPCATWRALRTSAISPALCHDVLQRLGPTLRPYQGCDLIDLNPRDSNWSRHLTNVVKPRRHIAVDDGQRAPQPPFPQDEQLVQVQAESLRECLDPTKELLSPDTLATPDKTFTKLSNSLLISAKLSGAGLSNSKYQGSAAQYFFNDLYASMFGLGNNVFRYGLTRVLTWLPDDVARIIVPRGVDGRRKLSLKLEAAFEITVVAAPDHLPASFRPQDQRWYDLDLENANALLASSADSGADGKLVSSLSVKSSGPAHPQFLEPAQYASGAGTIEDWRALDTQLRQSNPEWFQDGFHMKKTPRGTAKNESPEMRQWRMCYTRAKTIHNRHQKVASIVKSQRDLQARYRAYATSGRTSNDKVMSRFEREAAELKSLMGSLSTDGQMTARKAIDDYRAYDSSPRALEWNKRTVDPLVVRSDEDPTVSSLALLILTPRTSFRQQLNTDSKVTCFEYVLNNLTTRWSSSVYEALERLLRGGVDEFAEMVPSLKDPVKGGWVDLTDLRVRSLPASTFIDIALAYEKWPLRPETTRMMFEMSGSSAFSPTV